MYSPDWNPEAKLLNVHSTVKIYLTYADKTGNLKKSFSSSFFLFKQTNGNRKGLNFGTSLTSWVRTQTQRTGCTSL